MNHITGAVAILVFCVCLTTMGCLSSMPSKDGHEGETDARADGQTTGDQIMEDMGSTDILKDVGRPDAMKDSADAKESDIGKEDLTVPDRYEQDAGVEDTSLDTTGKDAADSTVDALKDTYTGPDGANDIAGIDGTQDISSDSSSDAAQVKNCQYDEQCNTFEESCIPAVLNDTTIDAICLPKVGSMTCCNPCTDDGQCASGSCLPDKVCLEVCTEDWHCGQGNFCWKEGITISADVNNTPSTPDDDIYKTDQFLFPIPGQCTTNAQCTADEECVPVPVVTMDVCPPSAIRPDWSRATRRPIAVRDLYGVGWNIFCFLGCKTHADCLSGTGICEALETFTCLPTKQCKGNSQCTTNEYCTVYLIMRTS